MLHRTGRTGTFLTLAALVALLLLGTLGGDTDPARASVPTGDPVFTNPTSITNTYFPFVPGALCSV